MAAKTESFFEADEEFEERISDELWAFYFPDLDYVEFELEYVLSKKRFDRAEKIIDILLDENRYNPDHISRFLRRLTRRVIRHLPAAELGCSETLQFMSNHFGLGLFVSDCAQKRMVVPPASLGGSDDIVDTPGSLAGNFFCGCSNSHSGLCCTLIRASARGDLEKVKRCLAVKEDITKLLLCRQHVHEFAPQIAAQNGHTHIVEVLFAEWERRARGTFLLMIDWLRRDVLYIACRSGNLEMAISVLRGRDTVWDQHQVVLFGYPSLVRAEVYCTIEIFRKIILMMRRGP